MDERHAEILRDGPDRTRKYHHGKLTFSLMFAFSETSCCRFSHDEVCHGKRALLDKMPGDV